MPINPPAPEPPVAQRAVQAVTQAGRSVLASGWLGTVIGAIVGGGIAIVAGVVL